MDESGHWAIVVSKDEYRVGIDKWGFPYGELSREIEKLLPLPPEVITTREIARRVPGGTARPSKPFMNAIQRCLNILEERGAARSVHVGPAVQNGWYRRYRESDAVRSCESRARKA